MRILGTFIVMFDESTHFFGYPVSNRCLGIIFGLLQMIVSAASFAQHLVSMIEFKNIFNCHVNVSQISRHGNFLSYDIVIFDFGLFHFLLGTKECIANYLDGGYMRCMWCSTHVIVLLWLLVILVTNCRWSLALCPVILTESFYALGLIILTIAVIPKIMNTLATKITPTFVRLFGIYMTGMAVTWFFTLIVWHYYWFLEAEEKKTKQKSAKKSTRRVRLILPPDYDERGRRQSPNMKMIDEPDDETWDNNTMAEVSDIEDGAKEGDYDADDAQYEQLSLRYA